jgi:hypothetical protein
MAILLPGDGISRRDQDGTMARVGGITVLNKGEIVDVVEYEQEILIFGFCQQSLMVKLQKRRLTTGSEPLEDKSLCRCRTCLGSIHNEELCHITKTLLNLARAVSQDPDYGLVVVE